jgi:arsenate reductase
MAAAWFNALADGAKASALSAGTQPAAKVHPEVLVVMREAGIDLSTVKPRFLSDELAADSNVLVTMGCGEACPMVPGLERIDWSLPDPKGQPLDTVRAIRDRIRTQVADLLTKRGWLKPGAAKSIGSSQ